MPNPVEQSVAVKAGEIKTLPYAKYITSEDVIDRNFGFKIVRQQVSSGRNSVIYKCETRKMGDLFCIIKAYKQGKEKIKSSLREEVVQIMRYVTGKCPQVVSTPEIFYTNEKIYLMTDWSLKGDVLSNLKQKGGIRLNEVMLHNWTLDIMNAVNFLHNNAICHRNIAPNCLLLTANSRVKIGTLGDAVVYCKPDGTLIKQKWPKFSRVLNWNQPPEVAKGKPYDPRRADIWSVGATIYWFITKNHPINYRSSSKLTKQLETRLSLMHKVSANCQNFVRKMLTYQPPSRPTISAAMQLDWIATGAGSGKVISSVKEQEAPIEIETNVERKEDPGDAVGPDDVESPDPGASTNRRQEEAATAAQAHAAQAEAAEETPPEEQ